MTAWGEAHNTATLDAGLARIAAAIAAHRPRPLTFTAADGVVTCGRSHVLRGVDEPRAGARRGRVVRAVCGAWMFEFNTHGEASVEFTADAAHQVCAACARTIERREAS